MKKVIFAIIVLSLAFGVIGCEKKVQVKDGDKTLTIPEKTLPQFEAAKKAEEEQKAAQTALDAKEQEKVDAQKALDEKKKNEADEKKLDNVKESKGKLW